MRVALRGTIGAALATSEVELAVPPAGVPLSALLDALARAHPRAAPYLSGGRGGAVLRPVHNGVVVARGEDPLVRPQDELLLLHAVGGG